MNASHTATDLVDGQTTPGRHRVVIVGSGFSGLFATRASRRDDVDITVIDRNNRHLIQPLLYLEGDALSLEGEELRVVKLGHTDTAHSTALHVASIGLVMSGDAVYNNTHPYLAECDEKARVNWLSALDKIEALNLRAVVAGHGVLEPDSSPRHIEETQRYIRDFNAADAATTTVMGLYEKMLALHPSRVDPGSLWATAKTVKPSPISG